MNMFKWESGAGRGESEVGRDIYIHKCGRKHHETLSSAFDMENVSPLLPREPRTSRRYEIRRQKCERRSDHQGFEDVEARRGAAGGQNRSLAAAPDPRTPGAPVHG